MKSVVDVNNSSSTGFFLKRHDSEVENIKRTFSGQVSKVIRKTFNFKASKRHTGLACFLGKENVLSSQQHSFSKGEHISKINLREVLSITGWQEGDLEAERRWSETGT